MERNGSDRRSPEDAFFKASEKDGYQLLQERQKSHLLPGVQMLWLSWSQVNRASRHPIWFVTPQKSCCELEDLLSDLLLFSVVCVNGIRRCLFLFIK